MRYISEFRRFLYREWIPVTKGAVVLSGFILVLSFVLRIFGINLDEILSLNPSSISVMPWTILTYPLVDDIISVLFAAIWLWFVGGSLERSWGSRRFGLFLIALVAVTGIIMALTGQILKIPVLIFGFWLPLVGMTWAWGVLYPDQELLFWGLFPIKGMWLAWIHAILIFATYAHFHLLLGLASVSGILLVYLFRSGGPTRRSRDRYSKRNRHSQMRRARFRVIK